MNTCDWTKPKAGELSMKKTVLLFALVLLIKLLLQYFLIHPGYDLQRDEYLHLDQGKHLAWGYISVPPLTSWISWVIAALGNSEFWVKFFPAFFGALTIVLVWKMIEELKGKWFALVLGALAILLSVILRINILYQPNSTDIFFWTLTYLTLIRYFNSGNARWLYLAGAAVGLGILSKYNIIFLVAGLAPALLLTPQRKIFRERGLYIAAVIALLIVLPNLLWQINNGFPTLGQLNELSRTQLVNVNKMDFVKEQALFFINSIFVIVVAFAGFLFFEPFRKYRFILLSYAIIIALYIFMKAKSYYAIGLYPVLIAFGSVYLEHLLSTGWKKYLRPVSILAVLVLFIPVLWIAFPIKSPAEIEKNNQAYKKIGLLRWEDGKDHSLPQDFADMTGWSELATKVDRIYAQLIEKENTIVLCDNYGQAGAINYYSKFKNLDAVSFNADYINWFRLDKEIKNVILVKESNDDDVDRTKERPLFGSVQLMDSISDPYARERGTRMFLLKDAGTDINFLLTEEIRDRKEN